MIEAHGYILQPQLGLLQIGSPCRATSSGSGGHKPASSRQAPAPGSERMGSVQFTAAWNLRQEATTPGDCPEDAERIGSPSGLCSEHRCPGNSEILNLESVDLGPRKTIHSLKLQAYLKDIAGSVPDHCDRVEYCNQASHNLSAGRGSHLQFVKNAVSVKQNETRHACVRVHFDRENLQLSLDSQKGPRPSNVVQAELP